MDNYFEKLNGINVSEHIEKKGAFCVSVLAVRGDAAAPRRPDARPGR